MASSLIEAITEYLEVPQNNEELVRAFLGGPKRHLVKELVSEGSTKSAAARQIERWVTGAKQKRNPANIRKETREKLTNILHRRITPVEIHVEGEIRFSEKKHAPFSVPPETIPSLTDLRGMLALADALRDHPGNGDPEGEVENVLTGMYLGEPAQNFTIAGVLVATLPWAEDISYDNCDFTITKLDTSSQARRRRGAA